MSYLIFTQISSEVERDVEVCEQNYVLWLFYTRMPQVPYLILKLKHTLLVNLYCIK